MYEDDDDEISGVFDPAVDAPALSPQERARVIGGRYVIGDRIGSGGMGQVLHVRHLRLGKSFALKLMQAEFSLHPEARRIFHREARLASALSHPNIVSIVDFGEDPDWGMFIVMEFLEGEPLSQRIATLGKLPVKVVCDVATQLVSALQHSHAQDIVHADLKSDNVFCLSATADDRREWNLKLLDFGMAHLASTASGRAEQVAGTPEYLAPERISGEPPRPPADIYALGIIMYEMLTGACPFQGSDPVEVLQRQLTAAPPPMAERRGEPVDPALGAIVERALAKAPANRYPDVTSLGEDLYRYMNGLGLRRRNNRRASTEPGDSRSDAAAAAFDGLPIPAAGLRGDGTIVVTNPAFARLLRHESHQELEGLSILETPLARLYPQLRDDLRLVAMDGKLVRRRLSLRGRGDRTIVMRVSMTPTRGSSGHCLLTLHRLGAAESDASEP